MYLLFVNLAKSDVPSVDRDVPNLEIGVVDLGHDYTRSIQVRTDAAGELGDETRLAVPLCINYAHILLDSQLSGK